MAWELLATHTDPENGTRVDKKRRRRPNHGNDVRFVFTTKSNRIFSFSHSELFDLADTLDDVCEKIEESTF